MDDLALVINYEIPNIAETYVHRIGRTGRAGAAGTAYSFCDAEERAYLKDIQKLIDQVIPVIKEHPFQNERTEKRPVAEAKSQKVRPVVREASSGNGNYWKAQRTESRRRY